MNTTHQPAPHDMGQALTAWALAARPNDDGFADRLLLRLPPRRIPTHEDTLLAQSWRWYAYATGASLLLWTAQRLDNPTVWGVLGAVALLGVLTAHADLVSRR